MGTTLAGSSLIFIAPFSLCRCRTSVSFTYRAVSETKVGQHLRDLQLPLEFDYAQAFSRNRGWVTGSEQDSLRNKRIAIAGLGGVGGAHLITLARLGIGAFHLADYDTFDMPNINRQTGAGVRSLGRRKTNTLKEMALDINPELRLKVFEEGVTSDNIGEFLNGVDLYVDGLDFFAFSAREMVFAACANRGIPATTVAPMGMGAALLNFLPGQMTFEQYFGWQGCTEHEMALRFLIGLSPSMLQRPYLVDQTTVDLKTGRGPSTAMACALCAGIAGTEALKILLKRGNVSAAPHGIHFDAFRNRAVKTWRPWGNRNPLQRLALAIARRKLGAR
jgi:molybdopterin/thiamine biosynthesis adenylyltransferase